MTEAVYIHIPFCRHKCYYCDFNTYALKGQPVDEYLDALEREMERAVADHPPGTIETIFVRGRHADRFVPGANGTVFGRGAGIFPASKPFAGVYDGGQSRHDG